MKIETVLNTVNSDKLQLNFNIYFNCTSNKMQHNLVSALHIDTLVISTNNTPWYFGGRLICEFLQNSSFWGSFLRVGSYMSIYGKKIYMFNINIYPYTL